MARTWEGMKLRIKKAPDVPGLPVAQELKSRATNSTQSAVKNPISG
jgi:hypothetical protein